MAVDAAELRDIPLFEALAPEDLAMLAEMTSVIEIAAGDILIEEGTPGDAFYAVLEGELEVTKRSAKHDVFLNVRRPGELIGEMSLLAQGPRTATVRALTHCRLVEISKQAFSTLLACSPPAAFALIHTYVARQKNTDAMLRQKEQMLAVATLSAGLAHELNNPAAAARRGASELGAAIAQWQTLSNELDDSGLSPAEVAKVREIREGVPACVSAPPRMDPMTRSTAESALEEWLDSKGVDNAWELAPTLVTFGYDLARMQAYAAVLEARHLSGLARWLAASCTVYSLTDEVKRATERISDIVSGVKSYSYLDQAPVQEVDVQEGLEGTLLVLASRLGPGIEVVKDFSPNLPHMEAYGSELNQVWTRIIDNALDAMDGEGTLTLRTCTDDGRIVVDIEDTGPGISPEILPRIFDPFFTTKPPGEGVGLGLNVAYILAVDKHNGKIDVESEPGRTLFRVSLPEHLRRREG